MAMVKEAHERMMREKAAAGSDGGGGRGDSDSDGGGGALRRQDAGADSYMLRIFGTAYSKVAGAGEGDEGAARKVGAGGGLEWGWATLGSQRAWQLLAQGR